MLTISNLLFYIQIISTELYDYIFKWLYCEWLEFLFLTASSYIYITCMPWAFDEHKYVCSYPTHTALIESLHLKPVLVWTATQQWCYIYNWYIIYVQSYYKLVGRECEFDTRGSQVGSKWNVSVFLPWVSLLLGRQKVKVLAQVLPCVSWVNDVIDKSWRSTHMTTIM